MEKLNQLRQTGCPVYTQKLNFNQCEMNSIVDFLLANDRIAQYLMTNRTEEYNALIVNNTLRNENEKLPGLNELEDQKRLLVFKINVVHRGRGTTSPVGRIDWKMPNLQGGVKMHRRFTRRRIARKSRRIARKSRRIARKSRRLVRKSYKSHR